MDSREEAHALEEAMYELLQNALTRAECAARAVARVEYDIVQKHMEQQEPPTVDPDGLDPENTDSEEANPAVQASREFNSTHFEKTFFNLNVLRVVEELAELLKLGHLEEEIIHVMVNDMFRAKSTSSSRGGEGEAFIGTDADMLFHNLRRMAEQRARGRR